MEYQVLSISQQLKAVKDEWDGSIHFETSVK
jgi:hypothetical protein